MTVLRALAGRGLIPNRFGSGFHLPAHLASVNKAMQQVPWIGRGGATDFAVLGAHLEIARRARGTKYHASVRDLADEANVSPTTASRANRRLCKAGWLTRVSRPARLKATHWVLRVPDQKRSHRYTPDTHLSRTECNADFAFSAAPASDVWRWGALGKSKARVYAALDTPATSAELARRLCVKPRTIQIHLAALSKFLLIERGPNRCWRQTGRNPDDVARAFGVFGHGELRRQQHSTQRTNFRQYVGVRWGVDTGRKHELAGLQDSNRRLLWPLDAEPMAGARSIPLGFGPWEISLEEQGNRVGVAAIAQRTQVSVVENNMVDPSMASRFGTNVTENRAAA